MTDQIYRESFDYDAFSETHFEESQTRRRFWKYFRWSAGLISLFATILSVYSFFRSDADLEVSKETTWIVEPLDDSGRVDYREYLNRSLSEGSTNENNAAIDLLREFEIGALTGDQIAEATVWLGSNPFRSNPRFQAMTDEVLAEIDPIPVKPWRADEYPILTEWLDANREVLDSLAESVKKPHFFMPWLDPGVEPELLSSPLQLISDSRRAARAFYLRSLHRLGNDDVAQALKDIEALEDLAYHVRKSPALVCQLIALAIEKWELECRVAVLESMQLSSDELLRDSAHLIDRTNVTDVTSVVDEFERIAILDAVQSLSAERDEDDSFSSGLDAAIVQLTYTSIDWNATFIRCNEWVTQLVEAMEVERCDERRAAIQQLHNRLGEVETTGFRLSLFGRRTRSEQLADKLMALILPAGGIVRESEEASRCYRELVGLACAIGAYHVDHGRLPDSLDLLEPDYVSSLPYDRFQTGETYRYSKDENGFELRSAELDRPTDQMRSSVFLDNIQLRVNLVVPGLRD